MVVYYIGADVHSNNTELAVERQGKIVQRYSVPTTVQAIRQVLEKLDGPKHLVMEEGPLAGWLYRNLVEHVDTLVVSDPRRNKWIASDGDKDDRIDAAKLAALRRGNYWRPVHHTREEPLVRLKRWVRLYEDRVREATRTINKLRACAREYGERVPRRALPETAAREQWLAALACGDLAAQLRLLFRGYDVIRQQVHQARAALARQASRFDVVGRWQAVPGMGLIRSVTLLAYLDTPWRFKKKTKLWKYCGVGLQRTSSGQDRYGREHPAQLELGWPVNKRIKNVVIGAALSAIYSEDNGFRRTYERMVADGTLASNARHAVARKLLLVLWGMWKNHQGFDAGFWEPPET
jgi:transposase